MNTVEVITIIGVLVAIVSVSFTLWNFKNEIKKQTEENKRKRKILQLTLFADYTKRYQEILLHLPENLTDVTAFTDEQKRYLRAYFDLCSEEYFLYSKNHLDEKVWGEWKGGMKVAFSKLAIVNYWKTKEKSPYEDFNKFVENDLIKSGEQEK
jgi:hypothetical protein